jgi:hypothetical protein
MMRLHSENDVVICGRCKRHWTGKPGEPCTICALELEPIGVDWARVAYLLTGLAVIALALLAVVSP